MPPAEPNATPAAQAETRAKPALLIRAVRTADYAAWRPLWAGYNLFYDRTLSDAQIDDSWTRLLDEADPIKALLAFRAADDGGAAEVLGLTQYFYHANTLHRRGNCHCRICSYCPPRAASASAAG